MTVRSSMLGWMGLVILLSSVALFIPAHTARGQGTAVRLDVPTERLKVGEQPFSVTVVVDDVANLGAFEFELTYDPDVVELQDVQGGPFLGSSGRRVECLPPRSTEGSLLFYCVTLGATPDGPTGSGVLATLTFRPVGAGTSPLHLARLILTDPPANRLPADAEDASVTVEHPGGSRWVLWGPVIAGVAVALAVATASVWWFRRQPQQP